MCIRDSHAPSPQTPLFNRSIPIEKALDDDTILAYAMNDAPLDTAHGGPLRLIVPGWAGDNHVKWLLSIAPQPDETHGFYMDTGYRYPCLLYTSSFSNEVAVRAAGRVARLAKRAELCAVSSLSAS